MTIVAHGVQKIGGIFIGRNKEKKDMYIVRSLSMANWLCSNGHHILKVEDSEKDSRFKVFLFEDTAALHNTMARFHKGV